MSVCENYKEVEKRVEEACKERAESVRRLL